MAEYIDIGNQMAVTLTGMNVNGTYLNSATSTYVLSAAPTTPFGDPTPVPGGTGTLSYVGGSDGNYRGTIAGSITALLTNGSQYFVDIAFSQSGTDASPRRLVCWARYRGRS